MQISHTAPRVARRFGDNGGLIRLFLHTCLPLGLTRSLLCALCVQPAKDEARRYSPCSKDGRLWSIGTARSLRAYFKAQSLLYVSGGARHRPCAASRLVVLLLNRKRRVRVPHAFFGCCIDPTQHLKLRRWKGKALRGRKLSV